MTKMARIKLPDGMGIMKFTARNKNGHVSMTASEQLNNNQNQEELNFIKYF